MPDPNSPEIPIEIPWQLASTTQHLGPEGGTLGPDTTTISLFTYVPHIQTLENDYPYDQLIYLKFTVSVSPIFLLGEFPPPLDDPLNLFSSDALPIWRLLFDVRISPKPYVVGAIKPYFLSATPVRRAMMETGVVGQQVSEGESKALAIGKSGSQMHEGFSSMIDTNTSSADYPLPVGGFSSSDSSTSVTGSRTVVQTVDTTQREASTERQELVSHMTNVTNILTLLSAYDIGSPYLRFSLWSRPLRPLTIDPTDPNLWYAELLRRRSSGIEGIQDFYAIAVVPRNQGFCIKATLRRLSYIVTPLPVPQFEIPGHSSSPTDEQFWVLMDYLESRYPMGTPIDELDVEPVPAPPTTNPQINRPVVDGWAFFSGASFVHVYALDVSQDMINGSSYVANYKSASETWLDMKKYEYEQELIKSPLTEGMPLFRDLWLNTCFGPPNAPLTVEDKTTAVDRPKEVVASVAWPSLPTSSSGDRKFSLYQQAVFTWNAAENELGSILSHARQLPASELRFDHPKMVDIALRKLASLTPDDPSNRTLNDVGSWFGLTREQIVALQRQGITDVRKMAEALDRAQRIERVNQRWKVIINRTGSHRRRSHKGNRNADHMIVRQRMRLPQPIQAVFTREEMDRIRRAFGATLQARYASSR